MQKLGLKNRCAITRNTFLDKVGSMPRVPDVCSRVQSPVEAGQPFCPHLTLRPCDLWVVREAHPKVHNPGIVQRKPFPLLQRKLLPLQIRPKARFFPSLCVPSRSALQNLCALPSHRLGPQCRHRGPGGRGGQRGRAPLRGCSAQQRASGGASATHRAGPRAAA